MEKLNIQHSIAFDENEILFSLIYFLNKNWVQVSHPNCAWDEDKIIYLFYSDSQRKMINDSFDISFIKKIKLDLNHFITLFNNQCKSKKHIDLKRTYFYSSEMNESKLDKNLIIDFEIKNANSLTFDFTLIDFYKTKTLSEAIFYLKNDIVEIIETNNKKVVNISEIIGIFDYLEINKIETSFYGQIDNELTPEPQLIRSFSTSLFLNVLIEFENLSKKIYGEN